ncbi:MAG: 50S ribosomal protein L11 methyltransferase [Chloroflexi bacterium]|nr:50S ribosomal protein L11 methyltransferase [Chloroflexota bacterium]
MRWREFRVTVDNEAVEAVSEVLRRWAPGGVAIIPSLVRSSGVDLTPGTCHSSAGPSIDPAQERRPGGEVESEDPRVVTGDPVQVVAYVPELPGLDDTDDTRRQIEEALGHLHAIWPIGELESSTIDEDDWANAWKSHYHTLRVGRRCIIKPRWEAYAPQPDEVVVELEPGMAFGTGLHPTTRMCLRALEELVRPGARVLDVGTGSGILAIAAARLGAAAVLAVDVDPVAVQVARDNVVANALADRVTVEVGSLPLPSPHIGVQYSIVVANIIARVIGELAGELAKALEPGGVVVAGGIIADRADEVNARLAAHGLISAVEQEGDWVTLIGRVARAS